MSQGIGNLLLGILSLLAYGHGYGDLFLFFAGTGIGSGAVMTIFSFMRSRR